MSCRETSPDAQPAQSPFPAAERVTCFSIVAKADPSVLPRVLDAVALLDLIPTRCHCSRLDHEPGQPLSIDLQIAGLADHQAHQIEKKLERMVLVTQILCSERRRVAA